MAAGIRCDIYSTYLRRQGFNNLFTLEGGVQNYLKQAGGDMWVGSLFVFDERLAIPPPGVAPCLLHQSCETQHLICMAVCGSQASFGSSTVAVVWTASSCDTRDLCPVLLPCSDALAGCRPALNPALSRTPHCHPALSRNPAFSPVLHCMHHQHCLQGSKRPPGSSQQPCSVPAGSLQRCPI